MVVSIQLVFAVDNQETTMTKTLFDGTMMETVFVYCTVGVRPT